MIGLLFDFAGLRAGSALKLPIDRPAPVWVLEPFTADQAEPVGTVFFLEFVQWFAFHGLTPVGKELARAADCARHPAFRHPPSIP